MKRIFLAVLFVSNVYAASEELMLCYDDCMDAFRYQTNTYPDMPAHMLMMLTDTTKACCAKCEREERLREEAKYSNESCHRSCVDIFSQRMYNTRSVVEKMNLAEELKGCHLHCDFIADLQRGLKRGLR